MEKSEKQMLLYIHITRKISDRLDIDSWVQNMGHVGLPSDLTLI